MYIIHWHNKNHVYYHYCHYWQTRQKNTRHEWNFPNYYIITCSFWDNNVNRKTPSCTILLFAHTSVYQKCRLLLLPVVGCCCLCSAARSLASLGTCRYQGCQLSPETSLGPNSGILNISGNYYKKKHIFKKN